MIRCSSRTFSDYGLKQCSFLGIGIRRRSQYCQKSLKQQTQTKCTIALTHTCSCSHLLNSTARAHTRPRMHFARARTLTPHTRNHSHKQIKHAQQPTHTNTCTYARPHAKHTQINPYKTHDCTHAHTGTRTHAIAVIWSSFTHHNQDSSENHFRNDFRATFTCGRGVSICCAGGDCVHCKLPFQHRHFAACSSALQ